MDDDWGYPREKPPNPADEWQHVSLCQFLRPLEAFFRSGLPRSTIGSIKADLVLKRLKIEGIPRIDAINR